MLKAKLTFEKKLLSLLNKTIYDNSIENFVHEINEKPEVVIGNLGLPDDTIEYKFINSGLHFIFNKNDSRLVSIRIYIIDNNEHKGFSGIYNNFINKQVNKKQIVKILGHPTKENNTVKYMYGLLIPKWISYDYPDYRLNFSFYEKDDKLTQISIMTPDAAPGRND